jgi:hypothetical protein
MQSPHTPAHLAFVHKMIPLQRLILRHIFRWMRQDDAAWAVTLEGEAGYRPLCGYKVPLRRGMRNHAILGVGISISPILLEESGRWRSPRYSATNARPENVYSVTMQEDHRGLSSGLRVLQLVSTEIIFRHGRSCVGFVMQGTATNFGQRPYYITTSVSSGPTTRSS